MLEESAFFKALSDPTRLRLAALLAVRGEVCVCYLAQALKTRDCNISRHLRVLRGAGIVQGRREGTWMHYRLAPPRSDFERGILECLRRRLKGHPTVQADIHRLSRAVCAVRRRASEKPV